jgi:hypothetical protein
MELHALSKHSETPVDDDLKLHEVLFKKVNGYCFRKP